MSGGRELAVGPDGSIYISDGYRIRRITPDGIINTVAGTGEHCGSYRDRCGVDVPATSARLRGVIALAVGPDGSLYFVEDSTANILRVGTDGILRKFAGDGSPCGEVDLRCGDGGPAIQAQIDPGFMSLATDGTLYFSEPQRNRVRRIRVNGIIDTIAGTGATCNVPTSTCGDYGPARQAWLNGPSGVLALADGSLLISDKYDHRIRRVSADGVITPFAGQGLECWDDPNGSCGDGGPAAAAAFRYPERLALGADGSLYISTLVRVRRFALALPNLAAADTTITVPSEDGSEVYRFSASGRHVSTLDALTGGVIYQFGYDTAGRLASIQDADGNTTTIERDAIGNPTAIVAPLGQRTMLTTDANGYLASITDPAGNRTQLTSSPDGLLATLTDPRGNLHRFTYDDLGRLVKDENPAGGAKTLTRTEMANGYAVRVTTNLGASTSYQTERLAAEAFHRTVIDPAGGQTQATYGADGSHRVTYPDGTSAAAVYGPDPRWGMQAPLLSSLTITNPDGVISTITAKRQVSLSNPADPFSLVSQTDTVTINGKNSYTTYTAATRTIDSTSAAGRRNSAVLDGSGRVTQVRLDPRLDPIRYTYNALGQITQVQQGVLSWSYTYDSLGRLVARADSDGRTRRWGYDAAGRAVTMTLPGGETYGFTRDASGNPTQVTMPSGAVHGLAYTPIDQYAGYRPPGSATGFTSTYDADHQLTSTGLPGGRVVTSSYDAAGRPTGQSYAEAAASFAYASGDPTDRVARLTRALTGGASSQEIAASYQGSLLTGAIWSGVSQGAFTYTYDANYQPTGIHLVSGSDAVDINLTRDADGLVTGYGPFTLDRSGPAGLVTRIADNIMAMDYGYDPAARPITRTHRVNAQPLYAIQLTRDAGDRVTRKVETIGGASHTTAYTYDANGQLVRVALDDATVESYTYDANGNRTSRQVNGGAVESATYDGRDRLTQRGGTAYQVDADGYLKARGSDAFSYSARGELLSVTVGATTVTYAYDALGRRVGRTGPGGTTQYLYGDPGNALQVTAVREPSGTLTTLYYDDEGHLYALSRGGNTYYVATDQVGTPRLVSDANGQVVKALQYDSFGVPMSDSNPAFTQPIGFAGGLSDAVTGLVHFGYRDYEPLAGRWTSSDPALFDGGQANLYAYVGSNPASFVDPTGLFSIGGSGYAGMGGGVRISVTGEGMSVCAEVGFGAGGSLEMDPFGDLDRSSSTVKAEIAASFRGLFKGSLQGKLDDCGDISYRPEVCAGPFCTKGDNLKAKRKWEKLLDWKEAFKGESKVQAKISAVNCYKHRW